LKATDHTFLTQFRLDLNLSLSIVEEGCGNPAGLQAVFLAKWMSRLTVGPYHNLHLLGAQLLRPECPQRGRKRMQTDTHMSLGGAEFQPSPM
jgi:hypothetical protein